MISRAQFQHKIKSHYRAHKRDFAWRKTGNPYRILVSEVMLQQTQTERVKAYYAAFLKRFPDVRTLAAAPLSEVFAAWKGLGYNRRAANLKKAAETIVKEYGGTFPKNYAMLLSLPGIGPSTAGAIMNFAFGIAMPFIETNIRSVFLHEYFKERSVVSDKEILALVEETQDTENPREWYYALYDYGVMLKKTVGNPNSRSRHYKKQSAFRGSNRELRAKMLFYLLERKKGTISQIAKDLEEDEEKVERNIEAFLREGVIKKTKEYFRVA